MAKSKKEKEIDRIKDEMLAKLSPNLDTIYAVRAASVLEDSLEKSIRLRMPFLSNTLAECLFEGYGPLSSFSAKIDIAFSFHYITQSVRQDMHAMRTLRNRFAHPKGELTFDSPGLDSIFAKFTTFKKNGERWTIVDEAMTQCMSFLKKDKETFFLIQELKGPLSTSLGKGE